MRFARRLACACLVSTSLGDSGSGTGVRALSPPARPPAHIRLRRGFPDDDLALLALMPKGRLTPARVSHEHNLIVAEDVRTGRRVGWAQLRSLGYAKGPKGKPTAVRPAPAPKKKAGFSLFGASPKKSAGSTIALTPNKAAGKSKAPQKRAAAPPPARQASPTFSLFGGVAKAPAAKASPYPILSKFTQNRDGSITGVVRNSKDFKTGAKITTSPVKRGAKAGQLVTTSSGSKYQLE